MTLRMENPVEVSFCHYFWSLQCCYLLHQVLHWILLSFTMDFIWSFYIKTTTISF